MALELVFLGTGTSAGVPMIGCTCDVCRSDDPRDRRTRPSVLIRYGPADDASKPLPAMQSSVRKPDPDAPLTMLNSEAPANHWPRQFLIDTTPELRAQAIGQGLMRIDGVFYTHAHADHIFGLDDLRRFNAVMHAAIDIYAEESVLDRLRKTFAYIFEPHKNVNNTFVASLLPHVIAPGQALELFGARWTPLRLLHGRLPILGFRVDFAGTSVAYCTDVSAFPPETLAQLSGLDALVIDGLRYHHHPTHLTVDQALNQIDQIRPRQAFLTHIAHDIRHAELEPKLPAGVHLAYDGLSVVCDPVDQPR
jgi:phosphoribosyl 1,2-cyclic phosphate phosphodiesterase